MIHNTGGSHPPDAVRALTINHVITSRFLKKLDEKNTRLTWLVIILAIVATIAGTIQAAAGIVQIWLLLHHCASGPGWLTGSVSVFPLYGPPG